MATPIRKSSFLRITLPLATLLFNPQIAQATSETNMCEGAFSKSAEAISTTHAQERGSFSQREWVISEGETLPPEAGLQPPNVVQRHQADGNSKWLIRQNTDRIPFTAHYKPKISVQAKFAGTFAQAEKPRSNVLETELGTGIRLYAPQARTADPRRVEMTWTVAPVTRKAFYALDNIGAYSPEFAKFSLIQGNSNEAVSLLAANAFPGTVRYKRSPPNVRNRSSLGGGVIRDMLGVSFYAKGQASCGHSRFIIKTDLTERMSKALGHEVRYEKEFGYSSDLSHIGLRFSEFKLMANGETLKDQVPLVVDADYLNQPATFDYHEYHAYIEGTHQFDFELRGSFQRLREFGFSELAVQGRAVDFTVLADISMLDYVPSLQQLFTDYDRPTYDQDGHPRIVRVVSPALDLVRSAMVTLFSRPGEDEPALAEQRARDFVGSWARAYANHENHRRAVEVGLRGPEALNEEFQKLEYGFGYERLATPAKFRIGKPLDGTVELLESVLFPMLHNEIPYEIGEFGRVHGAFTHAEQILSMMWSFNPDERVIFYRVIHQIANPNLNPKQWITWNGFFDGVSPTEANAPKYWVNLSKQIAAEK